MSDFVSVNLRSVWLVKYVFTNWNSWVLSGAVRRVACFALGTLKHSQILNEGPFYLCACDDYWYLGNIPTTFQNNADPAVYVNRNKTIREKLFTVICTV